MVRTISPLAIQLFASAVWATRFAVNQAQQTPFIPGHFAKEIAVPRPTSPPQVVRNLVPRDPATCGWMKSDGSANTCGDAQYCTTSASGKSGVWNCCNTNSCYLQTSCGYSKECTGSSPYCITSYMSDAGTTFSRFMCGTTSSIVFMAYRSEDLPQYTQSLLSVSRASAEAASKASASKAGKTSSGASSVAEGAATSSAPATTSNNGGSGTSAGVIAGAVVAAIVGTALIGGLVFFLWKKKQSSSKNPETAPMMGGGPVEYYKSDPYGDHHGTPGELETQTSALVVHELGSQNVYELGSTNLGSQNVHELGPSK